MGIFVVVVAQMEALVKKGGNSFLFCGRPSMVVRCTVFSPLFNNILL